MRNWSRRKKEKIYGNRNWYRKNEKGKLGKKNRKEDNGWKRDEKIERRRKGIYGENWFLWKRKNVKGDL